MYHCTCDHKGSQLFLDKYRICQTPAGDGQHRCQSAGYNRNDQRAVCSSLSRSCPVRIKCHRCGWIKAKWINKYPFNKSAMTIRRLSSFWCIIKLVLNILMFNNTNTASAKSLLYTQYVFEETHCHNTLNLPNDCFCLRSRKYFAECKNSAQL